MHYLKNFNVATRFSINCYQRAAFDSTANITFCCFHQKIDTKKCKIAVSVVQFNYLPHYRHDLYNQKYYGQFSTSRGAIKMKHLACFFYCIRIPLSEANQIARLCYFIDFFNIHFQVHPEIPAQILWATLWLTFFKLHRDNQQGKLPCFDQCIVKMTSQKILVIWWNSTQKRKILWFSREECSHQALF